MTKILETAKVAQCRTGFQPIRTWVAKKTLMTIMSTITKTKERAILTAICSSSGMDMEYNTGLMELIMKDNGTLIKRRVKEHFGMLKEMFITVN